MANKINYTKLINLIKEEQFDQALNEIKELPKLPSNPIQLILITLYCQIETNKLEAAKSTLNKALKTYSQHQLLQTIDRHLEAVEPDKKIENPLNEFIHSFAAYNQTDISQADEKQFNKFMEQILVKPYIK